MKVKKESSDNLSLKFSRVEDGLSLEENFEEETTFLSDIEKIMDKYEDCFRRLS